MAISVRGVLNGQRYTLPWHFNFRVDLFYCRKYSILQLPVCSVDVPLFLLLIAAPLHGVGTPTLATAAPTTAELPTTATTMVPVTSVETTMTPTFTQQPTTQQPTTERPTQRPTTQRPTTQRPTTQRPTTRPTSPSLPTAPPSLPPLLPPLAICNTGRGSNGELIISCISDRAIASISYEVNGIFIDTVGKRDTITLFYVGKLRVTELLLRDLLQMATCCPSVMMFSTRDRIPLN